MRERAAQIVLLIRAIEESDPEGVLLPRNVREAATSRALLVTGLAEWKGDLARAANIRNGETISRRARLLYHDVRRRVPALQQILRVARLGSGTTPIVVGTALLAGLTMNALGARYSVNLLSFPLLGLLAWNVLIYCGMVVYGAFAPWRRRRFSKGGPEPGRRGPVRRLAALFLKWTIWRRLRVWKTDAETTDRETPVLVKGILRFGAAWHRYAGALLGSRVRRMLHMGSIALVLGAVVGMYLRGIAFRYVAQWDSTLLDASHVQRLLDFVLGPAARILGVAVPDVAPLQASRAAGGGEAAIWIHLYAVTALLFVVLPRFALVLFESWRGTRLASAFQVDYDDGYYRRLFTEWRGSATQVEIWPYSFRPGPATVYKVKTLMHDYFGARSGIRVQSFLPYGCETAPLLDRGAGANRVAEVGADDHETCHVVLFNLAQPPESEVHGTFLCDLKRRLDGTPGRLLVILDATAYVSVVGSKPRVEERIAAWERVIREAGLSPVTLWPDEEQTSDLFASVRAALWSGVDVTAAG